VSDSIRTRTLRLLFILGWASLCSPAFAGFVDLAVVGAYPDARLEITDSDVKCGNDLNCIATTRGSELDVDFRLKQACNTPGPQYRLTGMQLGMQQYEPDGSKAFGKHQQPDSVIDDFGTDAVGNVMWGGNNKLADDKIKLKDKNGSAYVVYFQIIATHCSNPADVIYLDPRIENTGR